MGREIAEVKINVDLLNDYRLINPQSEDGQEFSAFMSGIADKLMENFPEQKEAFQENEFTFCLRDSKDQSIARVINAEYPMDISDLSGKRFVIMFTQNLLNKLQSEDEIAFVLGHELSHVFYRQEIGSICKLHPNEETACDLNSFKLMNAAGMDLTAAQRVDELYPQKSKEQMMRQEERRKFATSFFSFSKPVSFNGEHFVKAVFVPMKQEFKFPKPDDNAEIKNEIMFRNLDKVSKFGGRENFRKEAKAYYAALGSAEASKEVILLMADIVDRFPSIDYARTNGDYRKYLSHPVNVMTDVIEDIGKMNGKKLYPPQAVTKLNRYLSDNPRFYRGMQTAWDCLLKSCMIPDLGRERK